MATDPLPLAFPDGPAGAARAVPASPRDDAPPLHISLQQQPFFEDKNRAFWILQSAGWAGYFVLRTLSGVANSFGFTFVLHTALLTATGYSMTMLMAAAFRRLIRLRPIITWATSIVLVLIASASFSAIETWSHATFVRPGLRPQGIEFFSAILLDFSLLAAWSALYYGINYYLILEKQTDQLLQLEHQASAAQLAMLRYQLNPHFLFNTLNSISSLIVTRRNDDAEQMTSKLSSFLRSSLTCDPAGLVPLEEELALIEEYLDIEGVRFGNRLDVRIDCEPQAGAALIPSFLVQPLVENAIKHGVAQSREPVTVTIRATLENGLLCIAVENDTVPAEGAMSVGTGVGLMNVRQRLKAVFGEAASLTTEAEGSTYVATICIPDVQERR